MSIFERSDRLTAELPDLLTEIAAPRVPDYTDDVLAVTAATRQRPRWTFLERWLPMILTRQRLAFPALPWRPLIAVITILALLAAGVLIAGSSRPLPPPFGPARNGALVYDSGGDIYLRNAVDGQSRVAVGGGPQDFAPSFTRDGRHLTFLRLTGGTAGTSSERISFMVANADGSNPIDATGGLVAPNWMDLSPDDSTLVVQAVDSHQPNFLSDEQRSRLYLVDLKHLGAPTLIPIPLAAETVPSFRGPDGAEIVFRGRQVVGQEIKSGVFAVHPDGTGIRPLTKADGDANDGYQQPLLSPDGRWLAYTEWVNADSVLRMHLVDLQTGVHRQLTPPGASEGYPTFSPDGTELVYLRFVGDDSQVMLRLVAPGSPAMEAGPRYRSVTQNVGGVFSPDGRSVIVSDQDAKETRIVDATTGGMGTVLPWAGGSCCGWQRLAF
jgi:Tol biopolymer transport system component